MREKIKNSQQQLLEAQSIRNIRESRVTVSTLPEEVKNTNESFQQVYYSIFSKPQLDKREDFVILQENKLFLLQIFNNLFTFLFENLLVFKEQIASEINHHKMNNFKDLKSNFNLTKELFQDSFVNHKFDEVETELLQTIKNIIDSIENIFTNN